MKTSTRWTTSFGLLAAIALFTGCEEKPSAPANPTTGTAAKGVADAVKEAGKDASAAAKDAAKDVKDAAADVATRFKDWADGYSKELGNLSGSLDGVKDQATATSAMPAVRDSVAKLNTLWADLEKTGGETMASIKSTFKSQMDPVIVKVKNQITRLQATEWGKPIADMLKNVKMFE